MLSYSGTDAFRTENFTLVLLVVAVAAFLSFMPREVGAEEESRKGPVTVTSNTLEVEKGGKVFIFKGDVVAKEDFTLCSDELRFFYSEDKELREIVATGNIVIIKDDRTAEGDKAVYDRIKRTVVLSGGAKIEQCTDAVRGEKITVFLDEARSVVEGTEDGRVKAVIMPEKDCRESVKSEEYICRGSR
jgi:lipopolysaccharide export system protein LptA